MGDMKEAVKRVLRALHEEPRKYRPDRKRVERAAQRVAPEEDPKALAEEALRELRRRVGEVVDGLWRALGASSPPPLEVRKALERGDRVGVWCSERFSGQALVDLGRRRGSLRVPSALRLEASVVLKGSKGGEVALEVEAPFSLFARRAKASLYAEDLAKVKEARRLAGAFRPLFEALGLADLEAALLALATLEDGEARREGPYVLARKGELFALRRGGLLGTPALDGAFLTGGERVVLAHGGGLEVALRTRPGGKFVWLSEVEVRWGEEAARYRGWSPAVEVAEEGVPGTLLRKTLEVWLKGSPWSWESPKVRTLVEELARAEDPLEALKDPGFLRRMRLRALALL
jgi:hypothetical protein